MKARYLTLTQVAERWQCSADTVRRLIHLGQLAGIRIGRVWRVDAMDVERYEKGHGGSEAARQRGRGSMTKHSATPPPPTPIRHSATSCPDASVPPCLPPLARRTFVTLHPAGARRLRRATP